MMKQSTHNNNQRGSTLLEVLISIVIAAIGLLGLAALQLRAQSEFKIANFRIAATTLANEASDHIRNSYRHARDGNIVMTVQPGTIAQNTTMPATDCATTYCTGAQMFTYNMALWQTRLNNAVPEAGFDIRWIDDTRSGSGITSATGGGGTFTAGALSDLSKHPVAIITMIWTEPEADTTAIDPRCSLSSAFQNTPGKRCVSMSVVL